MNGPIEELRRRNEGVTVPRIWVAIVLSMLVHAAALWELLPHLKLSFDEMAERNLPSGPLVVQLSQPPRPAPAPPTSAASQGERRLAPPAPRTQPKAPPIAAKPSAPAVLAQPAAKPSIARADPAVAAAGGDMLTYLEAKRRARGEASAPSDSSAPAPNAESDQERANRIAALNVGAGRKPTFGPTPVGGGIFSIQRLRYDYAEFLFYGWNKDIRRQTSQLIEVSKGGESDIRLAVVRRMIVIIREHEQGDFLWESHRLGRYVTLSARARDNSGLEDFLMREFFNVPVLPQ